ncbi:uncharacterized protein LOC141912635 [Tubulanus polymorphus]|uniref:uncharacterized protein LOC141912635 n=1 Tax=Tubulanus polymorphus TaxID=672921 RepID=UPI003DA6266F
MKAYMALFAVLMCISVTVCYSWNTASQSENSDVDDDGQLEVFQDAAKRALFRFQDLKCATSACKPHSQRPSLRCCPGLRCKCGILWNSGQCRCSKYYGYGR